MDDSFHIGRKDIAPSAPGRPASDQEQDAVPFDIPQGWYDEQDQWHWYTEEEKEQVRLTMLPDTTSFGGASGVDLAATNMQGELDFHSHKSYRPKHN